MGPEPEPLPYMVFSATTDSSRAPVPSNRRRVRKIQRHKIWARILRNKSQLSANSANLTFASSTQSTEPVSTFFSAKFSTMVPGFSIQFPTNPFSTQVVGDAAASSSSLPCETKSMPEQSMIVVSRILKGIAQSPHFYQLRSFSELTRKSLICGWDQAFEKTVEELQSLQVVDFWVKAKMLWKTMEELQSMGYNVIPLRRRLVELTDVVRELKFAKMEIKGLRIEAEDHRLDSSRLESLAAGLQKMAMEEKKREHQVLLEVANKENELPKFDAWFAKLTKDPL